MINNRMKRYKGCIGFTGEQIILKKGTGEVYYFDNNLYKVSEFLETLRGTDKYYNEGRFTVLYCGEEIGRFKIPDETEDLIEILQEVINPELEKDRDAVYLMKRGRHLVLRCFAGKYHIYKKRYKEMGREIADYNAVILWIDREKVMRLYSGLQTYRELKIENNVAWDLYRAALATSFGRLMAILRSFL